MYLTLLTAERQQVPSEPSHNGARQQVERADEQPVVEGSFPAAVEARLYRKPLGHDPDVSKIADEPSKLGNAEFQQGWRVLMLEPDLHQLRQRIQPGDPVIDLKDGLPTRFEHATTLVDEPLRICCVLDDAVRIDHVEEVICKRQVLAVADA